MGNTSRSARKLIVCITGMSGAGKSTIAEVASEMGFDRISMGDVVREEARRRRLTEDDSNLGRIMLELRETRGLGAVAELCLPAIQRSKNSRLVVDGVRSVEELEVFKRLGNVLVISITSAPDKRKEFLLRRDRLDAPRDSGSFRDRDSRESQVGVGGAMAVADIVIDNSDITLEQLKAEAANVFNKLAK